MENKYKFWAEVMTQDTTVKEAATTLLAEMGLTLIEFKEFPGGDCGCGCGEGCPSFGSFPIFVIKYVDKNGVKYTLSSH